MLVANKQERLIQLQKLLGETHTLFTAESLADAVEFLQLTKVDVVIGAFDTRSSQIVQFFDQIKTVQRHCVTLYLAPPRRRLTVQERKHPAPAPTLSCVAHSHGRTSVRSLTKPWKNSTFSRNLPQCVGRREANPLQSLSSLAMICRCQGLGRSARDFAKAFSANSDLHRALNLFLDAIGEFLRPSRMSILVRSTATREFEIRAHRGLQPQIAESLRLHGNEGLPLWLMTEARILHRAEVENHLHIPTYLDIHREMQALRTMASIPLIASGSLVGILNLGERVTGLPYTDDELEILFGLACQVAISIQDINLHEAVPVAEDVHREYPHPHE